MKEAQRRVGNVAFIRVVAITPLIHQFEKRQEKARVLLARHRLSQTLLDDPYAVIPLQRFIAFFEDAAEALEDPSFGAKLGSVVKPGDIGPLGMLFSLSPTIMVAFDRISKFVNSLQNSTSSHFVEEEDTFVWSYRIADQSIWPRRQDAEYSLAASCQLVRSNFSSGWKPEEVHFEHDAPPDADILRRIFRAPVLFRQSSNRIIMRKEDITRVYRSDNKELAAILERHIADLIGETEVGQSLTAKVTALIEHYVGRRPVTIGFLAEELGMNARTLQRQLEREGTSVRTLTQAYRQQLAANLLAAGGKTSISDIAQTLGYADSAVFGRAFKTWTGRAPSRTQK
ncbi:AraC family transcriptional regulator [Allorhizobium sp. BGMRC 0089]|uniref:AraC family transcriptional regulator n=1 Tax=Allorhizobium sonneratiae TaxID=2934936 RepID=UPI002033FDDC|nr:AraC family transcriptional regulator [Allorhizobium sonneratiae]MCM2292412.1 AraC family transcriptional regulator [Allorhizobium sonneratiae]